MQYKMLMSVFVSVLLAELGDKTQLATMLFAADQQASRWTVFLGASLALVAASAIGVLAGGALSQYVGAKNLQYLAAAGFIGIGIWTLLRA